MVKYRCFAVIAWVAAFLVCACSKEAPESSQEPEPTQQDRLARLSEVYHVYYDITHKYDNATHDSLVSADTSVSAYVSERWHWQGDTLQSIDYYSAEGLRYTVSFSYQEGRLVRYQCSDEDGYTRFVYQGKRLDSVITYLSGQVSSIYVYGFAAATDEYPNAVTVTKWSDGVISSTTDYALTFVDGNLVSNSYRYGTSTITNTYTYDTYANPYYRYGRTLSVLYLSRNNLLTEHTHYDDGDGYVTDEHIDYRYGYTSGRVSTLDIETSSVVGKYINQYIHHYDYTYLPD